jgi:hypothetical protein
MRNIYCFYELGNLPLIGAYSVLSPHASVLASTSLAIFL